MAKRSHPPPWLFALSCIPYGVVGTFTATVMPVLAKRAGLDMGSIGWLSTAMLMPSWFAFVYAPIVDVGPKRKHWLVFVSGIGALFLLAACLMPIEEHEGPFLALAIASSFLTSLVSSCNGGLMAVTMPDELRGRTSAWYMVGNLSAGALSGGVALWLIQNDYLPWVYGSALAVTMFVPSLAILAVDEPDRDHVHRLRDLVGQTLSDSGKVIVSKKGFTGMLLFLSPVGTAALINYFSAMGDDYHVSDRTLQVVNGWANGLLTAVGAYIGGVLCDRYSRRAMYLVSGVLTAAVGVAMVLSPRTEATYIWAVGAYLLVTGLSYSAFAATVLETVGEGGKTASTQYALLTACGNVAIGWVGLIDTRFEGRAGVEGVIGADAALNLLGVVVLGLVFWRLRVFGPWRRDRATVLGVAAEHVPAVERGVGDV